MLVRPAQSSHAERPNIDWRQMKVVLCKSPELCTCGAHDSYAHPLVYATSLVAELRLNRWSILLQPPTGNPLVNFCQALGLQDVSIAVPCLTLRCRMALHYEPDKQFQSTGNACPEVLQNLAVASQQAAVLQAAANMTVGRWLPAKASLTFVPAVISARHRL